MTVFIKQMLPNVGAGWHKPTGIDVITAVLH